MPPANYPGHYPRAGDNAPLNEVYRALWAAGSKWDSGQDWQCIAHDDQRASLGVVAGRTKAIVIKCQAGCEPGDVLEALDLPRSLLNEPRPAGMASPRGGKDGQPDRAREAQPGKASTPPQDTARGNIMATARYLYTDELGNRTVGVTRYDFEDGSKRFEQRSFLPDRSKPYHLYRLPEVLAACEQGGVVLLLAGEKSVKSALAADPPSHMAVTTMRGGEAIKWKRSYTRSLAGARKVIIVADRDKAGFKWALAVGAELREAGLVVNVRVSLTEGKKDDVVEHLAAGHTLGDLKLVDDAWLREQIDPNANTEPEAPIEDVYQHSTDTGNARRMVALHQDEIRYCDTFGAWFVWNGKIWARDTTLEIMRIAKATVVQMFTEAVLITDDEKRKSRLGWCMSSESTGKLKAMVENARSHERVSVEPVAFDSDPLLLSVENGTLDLRTGALRPHSPADLITLMAPVTFTSGARDARWENVLDRFVRPDTAKEAFLQRAAFASLTGKTSDKAFINLYDEIDGNTGKTTVAEALLSVLGPYGTTINAESFLTKQHGQAGIRADLAACAGKRMVLSSEVPAGRNLDSALMKKLTAGAGKYLFERKFENPWEGDITFTIWLDGNNIARAAAEDHPLFYRWRLTPFTKRIADSAVDPKFNDRVQADPAYRSAVLSWALGGRAEWIETGMGSAPSVERAVAAARSEMDPLREFWEQWCEFGETFFVSSQRLKQAYGEWSDGHPMGESNFNALIKAKGARNGPKTVNGKSVRGWSGLRLLERPKTGRL